MTRTELTEYVLMLQLPIWQDFTNKDLRIQRNRIRHQLLPYLRRYLNPNVDRVLSNWTEIVHTETLFFESLVNNIAPKLRTLSDSLTTKEIDKEQQIKLSVLQSLPIAIQRRILKECVSNIDQFKHTFHFEHLERIRTFYQHRHK
jgi:tRNA(Ile)-lysidine synthase